jgi:hypothetical protein
MSLDIETRCQMPTVIDSPFQKTYRISYRWQDRHYTTVMPHFSAYSALSASEIMLMAGAKPYAIEEVAL